ncbi:uncharacterized protein L201_000262 [Kwoniella dendrophila CBS 6074]|uniref:F-box domain-containing protein n=1 Tax=Kwoniella dendrophila CBS 6074 TaxID=1295534 RepID=A0AAX4JKJ4_9TREE
MYDNTTVSPSKTRSPVLQRHLDEREELFSRALKLPTDVKRELVNKLLWSLPRNDITILSEKLSGILQRDIIGSLPPEITFLILAKLGFEDLLNCSLVSKKWRSICDEQALWALLCASSTPQIRPSHPTWTDITTAQSFLHRSRSIHPDDDEGNGEDDDDQDNYDDRFGYGFSDPLNTSGGLGGGGGLDPLGMKGGLRNNVWERNNPRQNLGIIGSLPIHLQQPTSLTSFPSKCSGILHGTKSLSQLSSHLSIPSNQPKPNFKHLYIIHKIIEKRLLIPRPLINNIYTLPSSSSLSSNIRPMEKSSIIPKPITIDAISSVKNGGLPGHSEAIYSLTLISHEMSINLLQNCKDCQYTSSSSSSSLSESNNQSNSVFDSMLTFTSVSSSSSSPSLPGQKKISMKTQTIKSNEWLLSGSRDKTLRLWSIKSSSNTGYASKPKVVKILQGGHSGSVLTHCVVKLPIKPKFASGTPGLTSHESLTQPKSSPISIDESPTKLSREKIKLVAVSGGSDGKICLWNIESSSSLPEKVVQAHQDSVLCVRANEKYVVSCSKDKTIKVFDIHTLEEKLVIGPNNELEQDDRLHRGAVNAVGLSDDYIISASGDKTLRIWSIETGQLLFAIEGHSRGIASIDFSTLPSSTIPILEKGEIWKGSVVTGASDSSIKIFHLIEKDRLINDDEVQSNQKTSNTSNTIFQIPLSEDKLIYLKEDKSMWAPCICPPGLHRPITSSVESDNLHNGVRYQNQVCGRCLNKGHTELVRSVYLGEKIVVSGSYDSRVKVWNRQTGQHLIDLSGSHTGRIFSVIGNRYKIISSGLDCRINIWNFAYDLDTSFVEP